MLHSRHQPVGRLLGSLLAVVLVVLALGAGAGAFGDDHQHAADEAHAHSCSACEIQQTQLDLPALTTEVPTAPPPESVFDRRNHHPTRINSGRIPLRRGPPVS